MKERHICFVTNALAAGGAERCISLLANEFINQNCKVSIVLTEPDLPIAYFLCDMVNLIRIPSIRLSSLSQTFSFFIKLRKVFKEIKPTTIICFLPEYAVFSKIAQLGYGIPIVFSERNDPKKNLSTMKLKIFQNLALSLSKKVVFQTRGAQNYYNKKIKEKSHIILNPFNTNNLPPYFIGKREKRIVSVGRLTQQKNQKLLITAFSQIAKMYPGYNLWIYGEGNLRKELEGYISALHLSGRVLLPGVEKDIFSHINSASIFVLTSDYEGLPNALIEAMALGLPCISTDCSPGGARELIENYQNGIVVPCGNETELANAISYMIDNENDAQKMGENARTIVSRMNISEIASQWLSIIS